MSDFSSSTDLPRASITTESFAAFPLHWLDLCVRGTRFFITRDGQAVAVLIPVVVDPDGLGQVE